MGIPLLNPPHLTHPLTDFPYEERRLHPFRRYDLIPLNAAGVWLLRCGFIQLTTSQLSGDEVILGWVRPYEFVSPWFTRLTVYDAIALGDVYLQWFSLEEIEDSTVLMRSVLHSTRRRLQQTEAILAIAGQRRVEDRLIQLLVLLREELGESQPGKPWMKLPIRFTHQTLASTIGTTRVTITRLLGKLQREGLIALEGDRHLMINQSLVNL